MSFTKTIKPDSNEARALRGAPSQIKEYFTMKVIEFIKNSGYEYRTKPTTPQQKATEYITSRIDDYLSDCGEEESELSAGYVQSVESLCTLYNFGGQLGESLKDFPFIEMAYNLLDTEISYSIIANMIKACTRYYDTMLSSDIEYLVKPYTWDELLNLITT